MTEKQKVRKVLGTATVDGSGYLRVKGGCRPPCFHDIKDGTSIELSIMVDAEPSYNCNVNKPVDTRKEDAPMSKRRVVRPEGGKWIPRVNKSDTSRKSQVLMCLAGAIATVDAGGDYWIYGYLTQGGKTPEVTKKIVEEHLATTAQDGFRWEEVKPEPETNSPLSLLERLRIWKPTVIAMMRVRLTGTRLASHEPFLTNDEINECFEATWDSFEEAVTKK